MLFRSVIRLTQDARDARYSLLRGYFHGADDDTVEELQQGRLKSVTLPPGARCLGETLGDQALGVAGVNVASVRQATGRACEPDDALVLHAGDTLVLAGLPEALALVV